jgi:NADPH:quinone reductase-like Zn-dependent oxidoreductase
MAMRAFAVDEFGATGSVREIPIPEPRDGEVQVAVHAAAVNVVDPMYVAGMLKDYMEHRFPFVPGVDLAGVVEQVGNEVEAFAPGDRVYGVSAKPFVGGGTFAEYATVGADTIAPKPETLDFIGAAAVPHVGLTALAAIEAADPGPGQVIVVLGATGGVGSFVTQLASARGATVVAVSATAGTDLARDLGAAETIDYESSDVGAELKARYPEGVDSLISTYGNLDDVVAAARAVKQGGKVLSPALRADAATPAFESLGLTFTSTNRLPPTRLPELTALLDGGQLRVPPITSFPLEKAGSALEQIAGGHVRGKLVIAVR